MGMIARLGVRAATEALLGGENLKEAPHTSTVT